jgi:hypothetical protein
VLPAREIGDDEPIDVGEDRRERLRPEGWYRREPGRDRPWLHPREDRPLLDGREVVGDPVDDLVGGNTEGLRVHVAGAVELGAIERVLGGGLRVEGHRRRVYARSPFTIGWT